VGTWAWGDKGTWGMGGYDSTYSEATIREAWDASIEAGVVLFDTAEIYGGGESERIIGRLLAAEPSVREKVVIATKFMPSPWRLAVTPALVGADRRHRPLPDPRSHLAALPWRHGRCAGRRACRGADQGGRRF
jgi:aryl-alcohol dehydrogenase-like predicted oxidoreductase